MGVARNRTIASLVLLLMLAACSREQGPTAPAATLGAVPSETATATAASEAQSETEPADPYAIPADPNDIDKEYVERVLEALTASIADAVRTVVRERRVTADATAALEATHKGKSLTGVRTALKQVAVATETFRADARGSEITVQQVISASGKCIFARVVQDTSGLVKQEIEPFPGYYHLATKGAGDDPNGRNPTPWMIVADAEPRGDGKEFADPCR